MALHKILESAVKNFGSSVAIEGTKEISYRDLWNQSERHAQIIRDMGSQAPVAILGEKDEQTIGAIWATLFAQKACLPLNPADPVERIRNILSDAQAEILISATERQKKALDISENSPPQNISPDLALFRLERKNPATYPDLAYLFATSGSTGSPKTVYISARSIQLFVNWAREELAFQHSDRVASLAPFFFDLSLLDLYCTAEVGATLVLPPLGIHSFPRSILQWIEEKRITSIYLVPSLLAQFVASGAEYFAIRCVKRVIFAGEVLQPQLLKDLYRIFPEAIFYNFYGPTETNVCTYHTLDRNRDYSHGIPIGFPCPYNSIQLRGGNELNAEGEIVVAGENVMLGYSGNLQSVTDKRRFSTGDWAKVNDRGELLFLGRKDQMFKKNGYRIEIGEIDAALLKHHKIHGVQVMCVKDNNDAMIGAALLANEEVSPKELKIHCRRHLPNYMIPDKFLILSSFPLLATGKIDHVKLHHEIFGQ